jgi:hypothetical protein
MPASSYKLQVTSDNEGTSSGYMGFYAARRGVTDQQKYLAACNL